MRAVARADGSVGRILDGHLNAVERLAAVAPEPLRADELRRGRARDGCASACGAPTPAPGEGEPARVVDADGPVLRGVKTFCSGAGGVRARARAGPRRRSRDRRCWPTSTSPTASRSTAPGTAAAGMRASESHRVVFDGAPRAGGARRARARSRASRGSAATRIRTAATLGRDRRRGRGGRARRCWPGAATRRPGRAGRRADLTAHRARSTPGSTAAAPPPTPTRARRWSTSRSHLREAVASAAPGDRSTRPCARCGSRPFATGGALDRARRDLELFLLQHRLDPLRGPRRARRAIEERRRVSARLERDYFEALYAARRRPVGLRDERLRARQVRAHRGGARRPALRPRRSRSAARSACSPRALAARCDALLAVDVVRARRGRARASGWPALAARARSSAARCPEELPAGPFDLIVCSEVLYYWSRDAAARGAADALAARARARAAACSPCTGAGRRATYPLQGDEVHDLLRERGPALGHAVAERTEPSTASTAATAPRERRGGS